MPFLNKLLTIPRLPYPAALANHILFKCIMHISEADKSPYSEALSTSDERQLAILLLTWFSESKKSSKEKAIFYTEIRHLAKQFKDPIAKSIVMYPLFQKKPLSLDNSDPDFMIFLGALRWDDSDMKLSSEQLYILKPMLSCRKVFTEPNSKFTQKDQFQNRFAINVIKLAWQSDPKTALLWMAEQWEGMDWDNCPAKLKDTLQKEWSVLLKSNIDQIYACDALISVYERMLAMNAEIVPPHMQIEMLKDTYHPETSARVLGSALDRLYLTVQTDSLSEANQRGLHVYELMTEILKDNQYAGFKRGLYVHFLRHLEHQVEQAPPNTCEQIQNFWLIASLKLPNASRLNIAGDTQAASAHLLHYLHTLRNQPNPLDSKTLCNIGAEMSRLSPIGFATSNITTALGIYSLPASSESLSLALDFLIRFKNLKDAPVEELKLILMTFLDFNLNPTLALPQLNKEATIAALEQLNLLLQTCFTEIYKENIFTPFRSKLCLAVLDFTRVCFENGFVNPANEELFSETIRSAFGIHNSDMYVMQNRLDPALFNDIQTKCVALIHHANQTESATLSSIKKQMISSLVILTSFAIDSRPDCFEEKESILDDFFGQISMLFGKDGIRNYKIDLQLQTEIFEQLCIFSRSIYDVAENRRLSAKFENILGELILKIKKVNKHAFPALLPKLQANKKIPDKCKALLR